MLWRITKQNMQSHIEFNVTIVFQKYQYSLGKNLNYLKLFHVPNSQMTWNSPLFIPLHE